MRHRLVLACCIPLILCACVRCDTGLLRSRPAEFTLMAYNVQTLFDSRDQGGEYPDFLVSAGTWDEVRYRKRLQNLGELIKAIVPGGPDILVLSEIENVGVLADLAKELGAYPEAVFSPDEEAVLACGLLSRFPVLAARAHLARPAGAPASVPRYLLEVELSVAGVPLVVLAAHWKSKLGGAAETEVFRRDAAFLAASLIRQRLRERPGLAILLAGDLNENPDEYLRVDGAFATALMPVEAGQGHWLTITDNRAEANADPAELVLYSPWQDYGGYSYFYAGLEERIDHILLAATLLGSGPLRFKEFSAQVPDFALGSHGSPLKWLSATATGYSDHAPVLARFEIQP